MTKNTIEIGQCEVDIRSLLGRCDVDVRSSSGVQAPGGGLKSAVSGTQFSRRKQRVPIPGPGTARRKQQLASGCTGGCCVFVVVCLF